MIFKRFRINILIRVILLLCTGYVLLISIDNRMMLVPIAIGMLVLLQVYSIVYFVESSNRDMTNFLESIRYSDFSRSFELEGSGSAFDNLKRAFNDVMNDFRKVRSQKEEHYFYLRSILHHIDVGILAYNPDGTVEVINNAAKRLFNVNTLRNIKELEAWSVEFEMMLLRLTPGENKLLKLDFKDESMQLAVYSSEFRVNERSVTLVSIKNIQTELEEQELEAWQKLIRVLTHEIMNSIAPITSLTSTITDMVDSLANELNTQAGAEANVETVEDIRAAMQTIHKRSTGLVHFVETYKSLTKIPKPNFKIFGIKQLLYNIVNLLNEELAQKNIEHTCIIEPETLELTADDQLIEQVVINLIKNSIQALESRLDDKQIAIRAYIDIKGRKAIDVQDNGQGILKEVSDKIFIPFFTTKPNGSGIGLSLSKQIMRMHGGNITVTSEPNVKTCFTLTFP